MENRKKRRVAALKAMNSWMNIEMSELRQTQCQANDRFHLLEERLKEIDGDISEAEHSLRCASEPQANLALEEYQMLLAYLDHKQRIRVNNERQHGFARDRLEKVDGEIAQQGLKIRGMENLLERRIREQESDKEKEQLLQLDEAWLQKQRDET